MAPLSSKQQAALLAPLNGNRVAHRKQSGTNLSYLEAWDVKAALIRVFGFGGFDAEVIQSAIVDQREVPNSKNTGTNWKISAQATVRLHIKTLNATYTETAIGGSSQPDITEALDMALKTAESDALKRAAIYLGTQFGLSLYDNGSLADVVRVVLAPDQEWPRRSPQDGAQQPEAPVEQQAAEEVQDVIEATGATSLDPDQHAEAVALVERGLSAKRVRDEQQGSEQ